MSGEWVFRNPLNSVNTIDGAAGFVTALHTDGGMLVAIDAPDADIPAPSNARHDEALDYVCCAGSDGVLRYLGRGQATSTTERSGDEERHSPVLIFAGRRWEIKLLTPLTEDQQQVFDRGRLGGVITHAVQPNITDTGRWDDLLQMFGAIGDGIIIRPPSPVNPHRILRMMVGLQWLAKRCAARAERTLARSSKIPVALSQLLAVIPMGRTPESRRRKVHQQWLKGERDVFDKRRVIVTMRQGASKGVQAQMQLWVTEGYSGDLGALCIQEMTASLTPSRSKIIAGLMWGLAKKPSGVNLDDDGRRQMQREVMGLLGSDDTITRREVKSVIRDMLKINFLVSLKNPRKGRKNITERVPLFVEIRYDNATGKGTRIALQHEMYQQLADGRGVLMPEEVFRIPTSAGGLEWAVVVLVIMRRGMNRGQPKQSLAKLLGAANLTEGLERRATERGQAAVRGLLEGVFATYSRLIGEVRLDGKWVVFGKPATWQSSPVLPAALPSAGVVAEAQPIAITP